MNAHAAHIDHPEAGRFDPYDRSMMRQAGIHVAPPETPEHAADAPVDTSVFTIAAHAEELRHRAQAMVDLPV